MARRQLSVRANPLKFTPGGGWLGGSKGRNNPFIGNIVGKMRKVKPTATTIGKLAGGGAVVGATQASTVYAIKEYLDTLPVHVVTELGPEAIKAIENSATTVSQAAALIEKLKKEQEEDKPPDYLREGEDVTRRRFQRGEKEQEG